MDFEKLDQVIDQAEKQVLAIKAAAENNFYGVQALKTADIMILIEINIQLIDLVREYRSFIKTTGVEALFESLKGTSIKSN